MLNNLLSTGILNKKYSNSIDIYQDNIKNLSKNKKNINKLKQNNHNHFQKDIDFSQNKIKLKNLKNVHDNSLFLSDLIKKTINIRLLKKYNITDDVNKNHQNIIITNNNQNNNNISMKKKFLITSNHIPSIQK